MNQHTRIRQTVEPAVRLAVRYWPNAGGDETPRENIRSAFWRIRQGLKRGDHIQAAAGAVELDAYRHQDM